MRMMMAKMIKGGVSEEEYDDENIIGAWHYMRAVHIYLLLN
jgi:hypothetical protein